MKIFQKVTGETPPKRIASIEIVTLRQSGMRHTTEHEIIIKNGQAEVSKYEIFFGEEEDKRELTARAVCEENRVLKLVNDCRLLSWDGFHGKHPRGVKDGTMFTLTAFVNGGRRIYASGSQNFPRRYSDFTDGLYRILHGKT